MFGWFLLGMLAAFGALSLLWTIFGWLLPGGEGCALVCLDTPDEGILSRYRWLRGMGLLRCPLIAVEAQPGDYEICAGEELLSRLERERRKKHGTGNGDSAGRGQRRGVSEL